MAKRTRALQKRERRPSKARVSGNLHANSTEAIHRRLTRLSPTTRAGQFASRPHSRSLAAQIGTTMVQASQDDSAMVVTMKFPESLVHMHW